MKVIATAYQKERLIIDGVDSITASMTAQVLNGIRAQTFLEAAPKSGGSWWFYSAQPDTYELKEKAA